VVLQLALDSVITRGNITVTRIRRGGYVIVSWKGDHSPRHIHVFDDRGLVVKWNLENGRAIEGVAPRRVVKIIRRLEWEGRI